MNRAQGSGADVVGERGGAGEDHALRPFLSNVTLEMASWFHFKGGFSSKCMPFGRLARRPVPVPLYGSPFAVL